MSVLPPEQLLGGESCLVSLVGGGWATPEGVTDGEDSQSAKGVQGEQDEDGERDEAVHHLLLQPPQVKVSDGDVWVQMRNPARKLSTHFPVVFKEV